MIAAMIKVMRSPNRVRLLVGAVALLGGWISAQAEEPQIFRLSASLDKVIDWHQPLNATRQTVEESYASEGFKTNPYYEANKDGRRLRFSSQPFSNVFVNLTLFEGKVAVNEAVFEFDDEVLRSISMELASEDPRLSLLLKGQLGGDPSIRSLDVPSLGKITRVLWASDGVMVTLTGGGASSGIKPMLRIGRQTAMDHYVMVDGSNMVCASCDLDFLFQGAALWQMGTETFEKRFAETGYDKNIYFEWLTTAKDRARFSRKPFSNVMIDLRLFGGRIKVEEATLDFQDGRVVRATLSIYNRGDSGQMGKSEFEALYKACGQKVGQLLTVTPRQQLPGANTAVKTVGWLWTAPAATVLMEHNQLEGRGVPSDTQPEFVRMKIAPPGLRDWSMGASPTGLLSTNISKASLQKNVKRTSDGDVVIQGVPMVDQGAKGYCVAASCQRLFEYYQIACDQHELAQLFATDADRGTNSLAMEKSLDKVDNRFRTRFKPLLSPSQRSDRGTTFAKFVGMVKTNVDQGIPVLWTLQLGRAKEDPPLPSGGQIAGGHMRMIIGYNEAKGQFIFTDSWGAGHELKRMAQSDAAQVTDGLYVMTPRS
ncbi:MAG: C39 family peptidase [Verrucomicrobiaceae bacterium]|nr:C39 family peptidase [Verrucomicrobiaceae bacterium]